MNEQTDTCKPRKNPNTHTTIKRIHSDGSSQRALTVGQDPIEPAPLRTPCAFSHRPRGWLRVPYPDPPGSAYSLETFLTTQPTGEREGRIPGNTGDLPQPPGLITWKHIKYTYNDWSKDLRIIVNTQLKWKARRGCVQERVARWEPAPELQECEWAPRHPGSTGLRWALGRTHLGPEGQVVTPPWGWEAWARPDWE